MTAILNAAGTGNVSMLKLLMMNNANPNVISTEKHRTTFLYAAQHGNVELFRILLNLNKEYPQSFDWVCIYISF